MLTIKATALTEKGAIKPAVRTTVAAHVAAHPELFAEATKLDGKNIYVLECKDADGNSLYVNFDVTVSAKSAADRAGKKPSATHEDIIVE